MNWSASAFVATPGNVPTSVVPAWITTLFVQVAFGTGPPSAPLEPGKLAELREEFKICAWAWGTGEDVEAEAWFHAEAASGFDALCVNLEEPYDAHGNQSDPRFLMPRQYLAASPWDGPLALTTTPAFASDMTDWVRRGAIYMPQAFPLENHYDVGAVMQPALDWGWPVELVRPLIQCYTTNGRRPDPVTMREQANDWRVGLVPYVVEQACDPDGIAWLQAMQECIIRPQPPAPDPEDPMTQIGPNHGATAACNRLRSLDPKGTKVQQKDGKWESIGTLTIPVEEWGAWDKLERSLKLLCEDHDA